MRIVIRTDASTRIGAGHVMRCLTLADALKQKGAAVTFISRDMPGSLCAVITHRGHGLIELPPAVEGFQTRASDLAHSGWLGMTQEADAAACISALAGQSFDWLIVDHYALDRRFQTVLRAVARRVMVIDDLADRHHDCEILLDQNLGRMAQDYDGLVPALCTKMIGPVNALLRPMFAEHRQASLAGRVEGKIEHIVVSFGGFDPDNYSSAVLDALDQCDLPQTCRISVIMGSEAPWIDHLRAKVPLVRRPVSVLADVEDMAGLMASCDLAIGAAGGSAWERCCLGVPSILLVTAANQSGGALALERAGAAVIVGDELDLSAFFQQDFETKFRNISICSSRLCDGLGVERVSMAMINKSFQEFILRDVDGGDKEILLQWANEKTVRENSFHQETIQAEDHEEWFKKSLADSNCRMFILEDVAGTRFGQVRFNLGEDKFWYVDYSIAIEWRGQGLGGFMLDRAILRHRATGFKVDIRAWVKHGNHASDKLFLKLGFRLADANENGSRLYELRNGGQQKNIIYIATPHERNDDIVMDLREKIPELDIRRLSAKDDLDFQKLRDSRPEWIFFPHWSWIIPSDVFENFKCVIFHMTDLPYGRGGSPLQNLIARGHSSTKISAIRCEDGVDTGDIYLKKILDLSGTAEDIFGRASRVISEMIFDILENQPRPVPQSGEVTVFKRRRPDDGNLSDIDNILKVYDFIRMLDADGYPKSFIRLKHLVLEFADAKLEDGYVEAKVRFRKKSDGE